MSDKEYEPVTMEEITADYDSKISEGEKMIIHNLAVIGQQLKALRFHLIDIQHTIK